MTALDSAPQAQNAPALIPLDIGHGTYVAVVDPQTAFWALVDKNHVESTKSDGHVFETYAKQYDRLRAEIHSLRFELKPSGVYLNPTERCNLNCQYCYLPSEQRRSGTQMSAATLTASLEALRKYFKTTITDGQRKPRAIFHGAEPLMNRDVVFAAIEQFSGYFAFGVQTNGTLLDDEAVRFLTQRNVSIGLSLDGPVAAITDTTRHTWAGGSVHAKVLSAMERLRGYGSWSVIATCTTENLPHLTQMVELFHSYQVPTCMLNPVRCTLPGAREVRPADGSLAKSFFAALDRTHELYLQTGRKLPVANFANILLAILAPTARRLMCDISPCGGGRAFFALAADGGLYPCSEFIGLPRFKGGNIFDDGIEAALMSPAFRQVVERDVDHIPQCRDCPIRHFCGAPCPAEAFELNGSAGIGAFCDFYKEQANYALRLIADGKANDYLWDGWDDDTQDVINIS
jgi:uncharacterized protein